MSRPGTHRARGAAVAEAVHDLARQVCRRVEHRQLRAAAERDAVAAGPCAARG